MKITNRLNLPQAFVNACSVERHNEPGTFSATTLNRGAKEVVLSDRHWDELEDDAADRVWATFGTAVHALLEAQEDNCFHEERFKIQITDKSAVTGCVDSYDLERQEIADWKTAPVFKIQKGNFKEWNDQGMTYAWLLTQSGLPVKRARFIALLKDHSKSKAATEYNYPSSPVYIHEFEITPEDLARTEARIKAKINEIETAYTLEDNEIPECTPEERWAEPPKYAVMKKGNKRAIKLHDNEADAQAQAAALGDAYSVEFRPGVDRKCEGYCTCREFCSYYKNSHKGE